MSLTQSKYSIIDAILSLYDISSILEIQEKHIDLNHLKFTEDLVASIGSRLDQKQRNHIIDLMSKSRPSSWNVKELVDNFGFEGELLKQLVSFDVQYSINSVHLLSSKVPKGKNEKSSRL